jgi:hypothetical protein
MAHEVHDKESDGKIILLLFLSAIFLFVIVLLIDRFNIFLMWIVAGAPLLAMVGLAISSVLKRFGIGSLHFEWLFQGGFLIIWLAGLFLISGFMHGLSVRKATLVALIFFAGAGMTLNYTRCMVDANVYSYREGKLIAISCVIAILWGISLFWIPSRRLVVIDWPCRAAEWEYEDAQARSDKAFDAWEEDKADFLRAQKSKAFTEWQACIAESNKALQLTAR